MVNPGADRVGGNKRKMFDKIYTILERLAMDEGSQLAGGPVSGSFPSGHSGHRGRVSAGSLHATIVESGRSSTLKTGGEFGVFGRRKSISEDGEDRRQVTPQDR
jgi:hypothetical protein